MAGGVTTTSDVSTLLKQSEETAVIAAGNRSPIIGWLVAAEKQNKGTKFNNVHIQPSVLNTVDVRWPYIYQLPADVYHPGETDTVGSTGSPAGVELKLSIKQCVVPTKISVLAKQVGTLIGSDNLQLVKAILVAQDLNFSYAIRRQFWGDATGVISRSREVKVVAGVDTTAAIKVLDIQPFINRRGAQVDVYNTLGGAKILDSWRIQSVDHSTWTVTLTGTALGGGGATLNHGCYLIMNDDYNRLPSGLYAAISDGGFIGDSAALPVLYWHTGGTATYASQTYATAGLENHKSHIKRLAVEAGMPAGTLQDWNEDQIISAAWQARETCSADAPKVDLLVMRKAMLQYLYSNSKTMGTRMVTVPPGNITEQTFGYPAEAYLIDEVFDNKKAHIITDEEAPQFTVVGLATKGIGYKWTASPGYFGDQMECLSNSQDILVYAQKFGCIGTPFVKERAAHFMMTDAKALKTQLPAWQQLLVP